MSLLLLLGSASQFSGILDTIELNSPLLMLDGSPMKDESGDLITIGKVVANNLVNAQSDDPLKVFGWCQALYAGKPIELDASDLKKFESMVKSLKVGDLLKAQALQRLE